MYVEVSLIKKTYIILYNKLLLKWHDYYYYYYYYISYSEYSFIKCSKLHVVYTESSLKRELLSIIYWSFMIDR